MKALAGALIAVGLVMGVGGIAHANIEFSTPTITPSGADFLWTYTISIDNTQFINTTANNASLATLYDINDLVSGSGNFTSALGTLSGNVTQQDTGVTPASQNPVDSPAIPNLTVDFTGTAGPSTTLGTLSFLDPLNGNFEAQGNFSGQATLNEAPFFPVSANTSSVPVPAPEPGSLVLLASGVLGMVGVARRRIGSWKA